MYNIFMNKKAIAAFFLCFLFLQQIKAQPPCPPFSPCWCKDKPNHPRCKPTGVSIDSHLWLLVAAGGYLALKYRKRIVINKVKNEI